MTTNINPDTGIAYGYISGNALDPELVHELVYSRQAVNMSYKAALEDYLNGQRFDPETGERTSADDLGNLEQEFAEDYEAEEDTIEGEIDCPGYGPVQYATSYLGGALNFWIFKSPFTTDKARRASPCVPNAGILDTCDGDVTAYDVPADWRYQE